MSTISRRALFGLGAGAVAAKVMPTQAAKPARTGLLMEADLAAGRITSIGMDFGTSPAITAATVRQVWCDGQWWTEYDWTQVEGRRGT